MRYPPDEACVGCDYGRRYHANDEDPWGKHLAAFAVGPCCAVEWIRDQFKSEGMNFADCDRLALTGSFRQRAWAVFKAGPDSELGRWFIAQYLTD